MNRRVSSVVACVVLSLAFVVTPRGQERQPGPGRAPVALPEGPGKDAVSATCGSCHGLNMITGAAGYSQAAWRDLIATMVALPAGREAEITQYLATHFPPKPGRAPELVAGDVSVTFREWKVPTLGPAVARSAPAARRHDLVERPVHQPDRPAQSDHRRDEGVQARSGVQAAQHRRRRRRQHLVHGQRQRHDRQVRAGDRRDHRLQDARPGRARSAHRHLRQ